MPVAQNLQTSRGPADLEFKSRNGLLEVLGERLDVFAALESEPYHGGDYIRQLETRVVGLRDGEERGLEFENPVLEEFLSFHLTPLRKFLPHHGALEPEEFIRNRCQSGFGNANATQRPKWALRFFSAFAKGLVEKE